MNVIDFLEQTPERVRSLIAGQSEETLSFKPAPDEFSLRENVLHLRDIDVEGYEQRIVRIVSERDPVFPDVNGARLARERNYNAQPIAPAFDAFAASRARSIERLRAITRADLARTGELEGAGRVTLQELLERWALHDGEHLEEMTRGAAAASSR
jgi:hypothetical protein